MYNTFMSTLLLHVKGSRMYNFTLFRPHLYIYDNHLTYRKRHIFTHDEFSITYNHISQVDLVKFIYLYSHIEIVTTAPRYINVRWIPRKQAKKAKELIDHKVFLAHKRYHTQAHEKNIMIEDFELSMRRLNELLTTGRISKREFEKRKKDLLKKHY